jgi:hypothetical protein
VVERVVWLTPYAADGIAEEARRAGRGARLEVVVPRSAGAGGLAAVETLFAWLKEKGVGSSSGLVTRRGDMAGADHPTPPERQLKR